MANEDYWYDPMYEDEYGERIRPVHKPYKASQCEWVSGLGWIYNPSGRRYTV